ncbi:MAG: SAM-dependent methyltransferase [Candidatus Paceibacteria bacterium]
MSIEILLFGFMVLIMLFTVAICIYLIFFMFAPILGAPYVPTPQRLVEKIIQVSELKPGETLIDLGSGDGRILIAAAQRDANAVGYEINPILASWSRKKAKNAGVENKVKVLTKSFWQAKLTAADVVTVYLISHRMATLERKLETELRPGTRVVSVSFKLPTWQPERIIENRIYLYRKK